jgi:hypothetical protein
MINAYCEFYGVCNSLSKSGTNCVSGTGFNQLYSLTCGGPAQPQIISVEDVNLARVAGWSISPDEKAEELKRREMVSNLQKRLRSDAQGRGVVLG